MPRAVLDTNIFISGLITPRGTPAKVLFAWRVGHFNLVTSLPLLLELKEALSRPHLKDRYHLSSRDIHDFITLIKDTAPLITDPGIVSAQLRDPDDLAILACALAGDAEYIITGDHDLLDLHSFEGCRSCGLPCFFNSFIRYHKPRVYRNCPSRERGSSHLGRAPSLLQA